ncbi:PGAP2-interacting protein [Geodia barretti]|nr:PGAP2-interacting protein [Geodia barretti]
MSGSGGSERVLSRDEFMQMAAASTAAKAKRGRRSEPVVPPPSERWERRHRAQSFIQGKELDELEVEVETGLYENVDLSYGSRMPVLLAHICFSFLWWSVFDALLPMLWFFPLCALQVSGYEPIFLLCFSPILALWTPIRQALATPPALLVLRLLTLVGVASYQSPNAITRLAVLAVGNFFALLAFVSMWWNRSKLDRDRAIHTHILGFFLMLAVRVWFSSFNPIFTNLLYNNVATGVGVVLSLYLFLQDWRTPIITSTDLPSGKIHRNKESDKYPGLLATGLGFGALMFLTLMMFGDVSIVPRWAVAPYPNRGPDPNPWSFLVMLGLVLGVVLMSHRSDKLGGLTWHAIGLASGLGLYYLQSYFAFFEGCLLSIYTASLWPHLSKRLVHYPPGKVLSLAILTWVLLCITSVWIVAYNFVPGGTVTRERTDVLIAVMVFLVALASRDCEMGEEGRREEKGGVREGGEGEKVGGGGKEREGLRQRVVGKLPPISEEEEEEEEGMDFEVDSTGSSVHEERALELLATEEKECLRFRHRANRVAIGILLLALLGFAYRYHPISPTRQTEHPTMFSAGIWAFHFGYDNDAKPSMERAAQFINNSGVDVIGLMETDAARPYIGNHDLGSWLSERLDVYVDYGPGTDTHTWG